MKGNKILIILCGLVMCTFIIWKYSSDDMKVISISDSQRKDNDLTVIDGDNYIKYVSELDTIKDVAWINEDTVEFKGKKQNNNEFKVFKFDFSNKDFSLNIDYKNDEFYNKDFKGKIQLTKKLDNDSYIIYSQGNGLLHVRRDKKPIVIANDIKLNDELLFKISDNKEKIAYYDVNEKIIKVYDFKNHTKVKIEQEISNDLLSDFINNINFSYEAGYLTISNINKESFKDSNFSVYGADSGKTYAEKLMGINPVWGKNNLTIAFTYLKDNSIVNTIESKLENLVGDRIGFFNLKTRRIKYVQNFDKGYKVIRPVVWGEGNELLIATGKYVKEKNKYNLNNIYSYDINKNTLTDLTSYFNDINNIGDDFKIQLFENYVYVFSQNKEKGNIVRVIDLTNRRENEFREVDKFITNYGNGSEEVLCKKLNSDKFLYTKSNSVYVYDLKSNYNKYNTAGTITHMYQSPDENKLFIISKYGENLELAIINL